MSNNTSFDIIIVGSGHAGSCTAIAASDAGMKRILIVEKGPEGWVGGNGYFTAGAHRTVHGGLPDLLPLVTNVPAEQASQIDVEPYTAEQFTSDIMRLGQDKPDAALVKALVDGSRDAVQWLANRVKVPYTLAFNRQAYLVNGRQKFWGGLALSTRDGGKGLIETHRKALKEAGVETWFDTPAVEILRDGDAVSGLVVRKTGELVELHARAVVLACGGYEASRYLRKKYMGGNWDLAKVGESFVPQTFYNNTMLLPGARNALQHRRRYHPRHRNRRRAQGRLWRLPLYLLGCECTLRHRRSRPQQSIH